MTADFSVKEIIVSRQQCANTFQEVLRAMASNTSIEIVREIGWYLWLYFYRRNRGDLCWRPVNDWEKRYYWRTRQPYTVEEMREQYTTRFDEALSEWSNGTRQRRLGNNFLAYVCHRNKSRVSELVTGWAWTYRSDTGNQTPEELAIAKAFDLLFVDAEEYSRIMADSADVFEAAERCETRRLEILAKRERFNTLFKKLSSNLWIVRGVS